jgi:arylformamidase
MIYDVSMPIDQDVQVYKNKEAKKPRFTYHITRDPHFVSETEVTLNMHTGTHLDFPRHMIKDGDVSTNFDAQTLFQKHVVVFDMTHLDAGIDASDVENLIINSGDMVFFKTKNSMSESFLFDFTYVTQSAAEVLAKKGILAVGIDGLGIERNDPMHGTHQTLMNHGIWIIEGLRLKHIKPGSYTCVALPINIQHADALPLRVLIYD